MEEMMKTNKVTKLGISLLSVAALGVVAPALTDVPVFGVSIVKADEKQEPIKYLIDYLDADTGEEITHEIGVLNPGETINIYKNIDGYEVVTNRSWMPDFNVDYRTMNRHFGFADGRQYTFLRYKKVNADAKPSDTSKPEVKPETKPSDTPKPEVKPEPNPSETPKPEVKPETKPSETPKPEVKPEPAPKGEENQEPLKYRITYYDIETRERLGQMMGVINPGQTINIYKKFNGHEIISKDEWMPNYDMTYDIVNEYFYGSSDGYNDLRLEYKKVEEPTPTPTPEPEVKPETKPSDTSKPEVKPAPKPSDTPKPEVKPEPKPSDTSKPEVKPAPKPSDTPKPEVKPEPKPSETPKPEVKPAPKPSDTSKPEVKPETKPSDTSKPEVKPELKPQTNSNTAPTAPVKPVGQTSNSKVDKPTSKKETPPLPNTGEQSSSLSLVGLLLASLGLAGLTYKGRH